MKNYLSDLLWSNVKIMFVCGNRSPIKNGARIARVKITTNFIRIFAYGSVDSTRWSILPFSSSFIKLRAGSVLKTESLHPLNNSW